MTAIQHTPTPQPLTLTVTPRGRVYLSRQICIHLGLRHGQALELFPPTKKRGGRWHLFIPEQSDAPLPSLTLLVTGNYYPQFDCRSTLSPTRFRRRHSGKGSGKGGGWQEQLPRLTLELSTEAQGTTGFLPLKPIYTNALPTPK